MPEGAPQFISEFSKENDKEGRSETARLILEKRAEGRQRLEDEKLVADRIEELRKKLAEIDTTWLAKVFHKNEIAQTKSEMDELVDSRSGEENGKDERAEANQILRDYYEKQKQLWRESGYDADDVKKYFTEENLEKLNVQDYALLLSRFPSEMATHVTRQGLRDHTGMMEHRAGMGEFANNFIDILKDGRLNSMVENFLSQEKKVEALGDYFKWLVSQLRIHSPWIKGTDKELISSMIDSWRQTAGEIQDGKRVNASINGCGSFGDRAAFHMARNAVLNSYYGGETENEIFFAYPIANLFVDHKFTDSWAGVDKHNDMFIWSKDSLGLSVDASLVFLPRSTEVDQKTGSRYHLDENLNPIVNSEAINTLNDYFHSSEFIDMLKKMYETSIEVQKNTDSNVEKTSSFIKTKLGDIDENVFNAIIKSIFNSKLDSFLKYHFEKSSDQQILNFVSEMLSSVQAYYKKAENTVKAEEYWETYFSNNPELKPSKIIYYDGDPTRALEDWL